MLGLRRKTDKICDIYGGNWMLEVVYMCKTCVIYGQSRINEGDLGVVYAAKTAKLCVKRSRYVSFTGETMMS